LLIENDDFKFNGYSIFPISSILKIRNNDYDKYFDFIMDNEQLKHEIRISYPINLESWAEIFESIKKAGLTCYVENENYKEYFFAISKIEKIKRKNLYVRNFDPSGLIDSEPTKINYKNISIIGFDDNYTNTMSRYATERL